MKAWSLQEQIDFHNAQYHEYSPLMLAAANGRLEEVKEFCHINKENLSVLINQKGGWNSATPLMLASKAGHIDIVRLLICRGAVVDAVNSIHNTALHLAAEVGQLDVVDELIFAGANTEAQNLEGQTPALLAIKAGHLAVLERICLYHVRSESSHHPLEFRNKDDKTALLVAADFGRDTIVEYILSQRPHSILNQATSRGITALMLACSHSGVGHQRIVSIILSHVDSIDVNFQSAWKWTALMWACVGGAVENVQRLLDLGADPHVVTIHGDTALSKAIEYGHREIVQLLLRHHTAHTTCSYKKYLRQSLVIGHIDLAFDFFQLVPHVKLSQVLSHHEDLTITLFRIGASTQAMHSLVHHAIHHDFFFDLFLQCIPATASPKTLLSKHLYPLCQGLRGSTRATDVDLLDKVIQLVVAVMQAQVWHPLEQQDLQQFLDRLHAVLHRILSHPSLDDEHILHLCLCYEEFQQAHRPIYRDEVVQRLQALAHRPLRTVLEHGVKPFFQHSQTASYVLNLFWMSTKQCPDSDRTAFSPLRQGLSALMGAPVSPEASAFVLFRSNFIHARFTPAVMFFGEGLSRLLFLALVFAASYSYFDDLHRAWSPLQSLLVVQVACVLLYDYGKILTFAHTVFFPRDLRQLLSHFRILWHLTDLLAIVCVVVWLFWRSFQPVQAHAMLSLACIPLAIGLLRYLSFLDQLGKLTIMIFAMAEHLVPFAVVFLVILAGYVLTMTALFAHPGRMEVSAFRTPLQSTLTLFSSSLSNYEPSFTETFRSLPSLEIWGIVVQLAFVVWFSVVMLNVVIARMSATHQRIDEEARQEWVFAQAQTVSQFAILTERHPFAALPPPLNALTAILLPIHYAWLYYAVPHTDASLFSWTGSLADWVSGSLMVLLGPLLELVIYLRKYCDRRSPQPISTQECLLVVALFPVLWYPLMAMAFFVRLLHQSTRVVVFREKAVDGALPARKMDAHHASSGQTPASPPSMSSPCVVEALDVYTAIRDVPGSFQARIQYPLAVFYTPAISPEAMRRADRLTVQLVRIHGLRLAHHRSNPVVYFRLGAMELRSGASLYGGSHPLWLKEEVCFPLAARLHLDQLLFHMLVVDREPLTGHEVFLGESRPQPVKEWLANGQFAGSVPLEGGLGEVVLSVAVVFPSFLATFQRGGGREKASDSMSSIRKPQGDVGEEEEDKEKEDEERRVGGQGQGGAGPALQALSRPTGLHFVANLKVQLRRKRRKSTKAQPRQPRPMPSASETTGREEGEEVDDEDEDEDEEEDAGGALGEGRGVGAPLVVPPGAVHLRGLHLFTRREKEAIFAPLLRPPSSWKAEKDKDAWPSIQRGTDC